MYSEHLVTRICDSLTVASESISLEARLDMWIKTKFIGWMGKY